MARFLFPKKIRSINCIKERATRVGEHSADLGRVVMVLSTTPRASGSGSPTRISTMIKLRRSLGGMGPTRTAESTSDELSHVVGDDGGYNTPLCRVWAKILTLTCLLLTAVKHVYNSLSKHCRQYSCTWYIVPCPLGS